MPALRSVHQSINQSINQSFITNLSPDVFESLVASLVLTRLNDGNSVTSQPASLASHSTVAY